MAITHVSVHPAIGIARLGNSDRTPYVGPEGPAWVPPGPDEVKDAGCAIVKQAARFRLFAFDGNTPVGEVTSDRATIHWHVHVANRKAAAPTRNPGVDKSWLVIDPGHNGGNGGVGFIVVD